MSRYGKPVLPGATIGVLGSGQLGRMFAIAARQMGYRVRTFSPETDTPTGQVADIEVTATYLDLDAVRAFARGVEVITFEFENVPVSCIEAAAACVPVRPRGSILHTTQNRLREKRFLSLHGFPHAAFAPVATAADLAVAGAKVGFPAVMKTSSWGYDGKGQTTVLDADQALKTFLANGSSEMILERFVDFELEFSVIVARGVDGSFSHWGLIRNHHERHVLDFSVAPAPIASPVAERAVDIARDIAEQLALVGVLCVEFFLTRDQGIVVNELAPRPHNSGHLTIDAAHTSQFEQQVRAVCGLPLGSTALIAAAAMANLLGDLWSGGQPNWPAACAVADTKLHLYGKTEPRPGRKMGHITALDRSPEEAMRRALLARARLAPPTP